MGKHMIIGVLFLLLGISILLKALFHIDIPLFRTAAALFIIYIGIKMLVGGFGWHSRWEWDDAEGDGHSAVFHSRTFEWDSTTDKPQQYAVVFGSGTVDLTKVAETKADSGVEVNCVFGDTKVLLSRKTNITIQSNAVMGDSSFPNGDSVSFGSMGFKNPADANAPKLHIRSNAVFGSVKFIFKD